MAVILIFLAISGLFFILGTGMEGAMSSFIHNNKMEVVRRLQEQIKKDAWQDALRGEEGTFMGFSSLEEYCRTRGVVCGSSLFWTIESLEQDQLPYKLISIFERQPGGRNIMLAQVNTYPEVLEHVQRLDDRLGLLCTELYRYQTRMREIAKVDLNFLARDEGGCQYDGANEFRVGVDRVVRKELECTNGYVELRNLSGWRRVFGDSMLDGVWGSNVNGDVERECGVSYGYVVVGLRFGNREYRVCCGG